MELNYYHYITDTLSICIPEFFMAHTHTSPLRQLSHGEACIKVSWCHTTRTTHTNKWVCIIKVSKQHPTGKLRSPPEPHTYHTGAVSVV